MSTYKTPYEILGLKSGASLADIKEAYRNLCKQHHPDLCPQHQKAAAEKYFKEVTAAYTKLSRDYSNQGSSGHHAASTSSHAHAQWARAASATTHGRPMKYSNGVVGAVIAAPLFLLGVWLQHKSNSASSSGDVIRPHGILHPPQNPFLKEEYRPRMQRRFWDSGWNAGKGKQMGTPPSSKRNHKEVETAAAAAAAEVATT